MRVKIFSTLACMDMKDWILAARIHAQMTQPQLGEALGVTKGNVSAWENGRHEASHDQLIRIAATTGYPEPLPGMTEPVEAPAPRWPFQAISLSKIESLKGEDLTRLEGAFLLSAAQLGLDVKK